MTSGYDLPPDSPGFAEAQAEMSSRSQEAGKLPGMRRDLSYGAGPRQKLDIFPAGPKAPVLLFLRGGYWKIGEKEDRWFPALAWQPRGVSWVVPNYRLAPEVCLPEIVDDARAALNWIARNAADHGLDAEQIHLVGNSAGAHLAAMAAAGPGVDAIRSMTLISGLYDLTPLLAEEVNTWLRLDPATAHAMSPVSQLPVPALPVTICCGGAESAAFLHQSQTYADRLRQNGNRVTYFESPGQNHMQIITECGTPGTPVFDALERHVLR